MSTILIWTKEFSALLVELLSSHCSLCSTSVVSTSFFHVRYFFLDEFNCQSRFFSSLFGYLILISCYEAWEINFYRWKCSCFGKGIVCCHKLKMIENVNIVVQNCSSIYLREFVWHSRKSQPFVVICIIQCACRQSGTSGMFLIGVTNNISPVLIKRQPVGSNQQEVIVPELIIKITISSIVIGLKNSCFSLIH